MDTKVANPRVKRDRSDTPDLSADIAQTMDKRPGERVKCTRVYGDNYRCNWIAPDKRASALAPRTTMTIPSLYIRRSKMLRVRKTSGGLVVEDSTGKSRPDDA